MWFDVILGLPKYISDPLQVENKAAQPFFLKKEVLCVGPPQSNHLPATFKKMNFFNFWVFFPIGITCISCFYVRFELFQKWLGIK